MTAGELLVLNGIVVVIGGMVGKQPIARFIGTMALLIGALAVLAGK